MIFFFLVFKPYRLFFAEKKTLKTFWSLVEVNSLVTHSGGECVLTDVLRMIPNRVCE